MEESRLKDAGILILINVLNIVQASSAEYQSGAPASLSLGPPTND
jgi:hypothetical protein